MTTAAIAAEAGPAQRVSATTRAGYVDLFRGLLIAHMALDHVSMMLNRNRGGEELWVHAPAPPVDFGQFLTRFTGVPVAPAFCFMAGFMVATTTAARMGRGVTSSDVTRRLVTRGLVLIGVDAIIMGLPRAAMGFYSFMVLSSIGVSILALTFLRDLPLRWLLLIALAVLGLHPLLDVSMLPVPIRAVIYEPVRQGVFRSMYPIIPWIGFVLLGFVIGRDAPTRERPERLWLGLSAASLALLFVIRIAGGYGNAYPYTSLTSLDFWYFSKYPPDLPFITFSLAVVFVTLAGLRHFFRDHVPGWLSPFVVFGRVPFFFYVVHFYVIGPVAGPIGRKLDLSGTYLVWVLLLAFLLWPCAWYYKKKIERPNFITRYL